METQEQWAARNSRKKAENPNLGQLHRPLTVATANWPTAAAGDAKASGSRELPGSNAHDGKGLTDVGVRGWPTPKAADGRAKGNGGDRNSPGCDQMAKGWPTPAARDWKCAGGQQNRNDPNLPDRAQQWATPRTITGGPESAKRKQELGRTASGGGDLQAQSIDLSGPPAPTPRSGKESKPRLNPRFVEWLMGLPAGWSDPGSPVSATELSHWRQRMRFPC